MTEGAAGAGREDSSEISRGGPGDPLGRIVFAVLVVACFGAFFLTQRLKHTPTVVQTPRLTPYFSPYRGGHVPLEAISFKLATADRATVTIIDSQGNTVATLLREFPVPRYKTLSLRWNGRRGVARGYTVKLSNSGRSKQLIPHLHGRWPGQGNIACGSASCTITR